MSRYLSAKYENLTPYTPGEQPSQMKYVKLNTNESPFPPSERAMAYARAHARPLNLYSDPEAVELKREIAGLYGLEPENVLPTNGSDEILNFAFMAFCDKDRPAAFADITYGFYKVFAQINGVPYVEIPLKEDFFIDPADYMGLGKTIFIANPNAPTGRLLPRADLEAIIAANPTGVVVVDEAYIDFGGESCAPLVKKYDNLLVTQTFSKSRSMAGARLGFGLAGAGLMADLNAIKYSTNPYNVNSLTLALGVGVLRDGETTRNNCRTIMENRAYLARSLEARGFAVLPSSANFVFAATPRMEGGALYLRLKERGVLVRHFDQARIRDYNRITVGTAEQIDALLAALDEILEERA